MSLVEKSEVFLFWSSIALSKWLSFVLLSMGVGTTVMHVTRAILFRLFGFPESLYGLVSFMDAWWLLHSVFVGLCVLGQAARLYYPSFERVKSCLGRKEKCQENNFYHFLHDLFGFPFHSLSLAMAICLPLEYKMNGNLWCCMCC